MSISGWQESNNIKYKDIFIDKSNWELVDKIGNIYNRLVIFKSHNIHAVSDYFGEDINNSRLFQLFFFDIEKKTILPNVSEKPVSHPANIIKNNYKIGMDIGACDGDTLNLFSDFETVFAFEPSPIPFRSLITNLKKWNNNIIPFNYAISDKNDITKFYCHEHRGYSSLLKIDKNSEFYNHCNNIDKGFDEIISENFVQTKRLDTFFEENFLSYIDFIKIDTQGNDFKVIQSLGKYLKYVGKIEMELQLKTLYKKSIIDKNEIISFMEKNNFILDELVYNSDAVINFEERLLFKNNLNLEDYFIFLPHTDIIGYDIYLKETDLKTLLYEALHDIDCVSVNTMGYFKNNCTELKFIKDWDVNNGIYIKKTQINNLNLPDIQYFCNIVSINQNINVLPSNIKGLKDIYEHLPTLYKYATECSCILECGVRECISTWSFVKGLIDNNTIKKKLLVNDIEDCSNDNLFLIEHYCNKYNICFEKIWQNNFDLNTESTEIDMVFIDTWHVYGQLKRELAKFSKIATKYIILHDTHIDEFIGESIRCHLNIDEQMKTSGYSRWEIENGLGLALKEFIETDDEWYVEKRFLNCNGLTILKKKVNLPEITESTEENIAVLVPVSSNKKDWSCFKDTDLYRFLFKSFALTRNKEYVYTFFIGINEDDILFMNDEVQSEITQFISTMKNTEIFFYKFGNKYKENPCYIWNELYKIALSSVNNKYFIQISSDIEILDGNWMYNSIKKLKKKNDLGVIGFNDFRRKEIDINNILFTQTIVSRKHFDIFGFYFPPELESWYNNNWISDIYNLYKLNQTIHNRIISWSPESTPICLEDCYTIHMDCYNKYIICKDKYSSVIKTYTDQEINSICSVNLNDYSSNYQLNQDTNTTHTDIIPYTFSKLDYIKNTDNENENENITVQINSIENLECKIIDCFIFYNELDLLNYRLSLLDNVVDYFVLVESRHTHSGNKTKLYYNENKHLFEKYNTKIIHIIVDDFKYINNIENKNSKITGLIWGNEIYHRNCIKKGLEEISHMISEDDYIIITDLDEIPNPNILYQFKQQKYNNSVYSLEMDLYYYNLNHKSKDQWYSGKIIRYSWLLSQNFSCNEVRFLECEIIKNSGWHLSYFGDIDFVKNKLKSFAHQEFNTKDVFENLEKNINNKSDLLGRKDVEIVFIETCKNKHLPPNYKLLLKNFYKKTIIFHDNIYAERGTSIAVYDYAYYNEKILGNKSIILINENETHNEQVINKFKSDFDMVYYDKWSNIECILDKNNIYCDLLYMIKYGINDDKVLNNINTAVHCVFECNDPHGDYYTSIIPCIQNDYNYPTIPHMINLPDTNDDLRKELNIPDDSVVFGRLGGYEQFDIEYVKNVIIEYVSINKNVYFVFANTAKFCNLPNIFFLDKIIDLVQKVKFINSCNAMIWARSDGEIFGLTIGEFSSKNKPIICCECGYNLQKYMLQNKGLWYNDKDTLLKQLNYIVENKNIIKNNDWNNYKQYTPYNVINIFNNVLLKNITYNDYNNIGIAILTWNKPITLENTLESYKKYKFLDYFNEKIILLQENNPKERKIAEKYNLEIYSTEQNLLIGGGINFLVDRIKSKYFIIIQNDFELINDDFKNQLESGIRLIKKNIINCLRLRSIKYPGYPCYGKDRIPEPEGDLPSTHISELIYNDENNLNNVSIKYPHIFKKNTDENIVIVSSNYSNYTENPCLYNTDWYRNNIYKFNGNNHSINSEQQVQDIWCNLNLLIGFSNGIFIHKDIELHDNFYFFSGYDQIDNDIYRYENTSVDALIKLSDSDNNCIGFNTVGYCKNEIIKLEKQPVFEKNDGIYIKKTSCPPIPVLGVLIYNGIDWIEKQLESIDYPIENYILINNGGDKIKSKLDKIMAIPHQYIKNKKVYHMPNNIGVAAGWNLIIKTFMLSPYWIISNHDVHFSPGFLHELYIKSLEEDVGLIHGKPGDFNLGCFDLFLIKDWVIQSHGLFDDNFYPAYCEDSDYIMRLLNKPVKSIKNMEKKYYHGNSTEYYDEHGGGNTQKECSKMKQKLIFANQKNFEYMNQKWGEGWRNCNPYKTPFNNNNNLNITSFDLDYNRAKYTP